MSAPVPLQRLIDALQVALLTAQSLDARVHEQSEETTRLRRVLTEASQYAHDLRATDRDNPEGGQ